MTMWDAWADFCYARVPIHCLLDAALVMAVWAFWSTTPLLHLALAVLWLAGAFMVDAALTEDGQRHWATP